MGVMILTGAGGAALMEGGAPAAAGSEAACSSASFRALLPSNTWTCVT